MNVESSNLDKESLLLMYIGGELDAETARQVEANLARDAELRAQLESLKVMDADLRQWAMAENSQPVAHLDASLRNALSMMRKHTLTSPLSKTNQDAHKKTSGWKWRMAIAAMLVAGLAMMFLKRSKNDLAINPTDNSGNDLVALNTNPGDGSDMFDAPMSELANTDLDLVAVGDLAQMLK